MSPAWPHVTAVGQPWEKQPPRLTGYTQKATIWGNWGVNHRGSQSGE